MKRIAPVAMACAVSVAAATAVAENAQPRYDIAQVVRVEPVVEYRSRPQRNEYCYQQPETVVVYAPSYPPAYPPAYAGPSYGIGVSYGGYGGGHGRGHGYGHRGYGRGGGHGGSYFEGSYYAGGYGGNGEGVLGAIAGGLLGNQFGHGGGRVATTFFGAVLGDALVADYQRSSYPGGYSSGYAAPQPVSQQVVYRERCETRTEYVRDAPETGYDVTYRYQGRLYHIRTPFDPGESIRVRVDDLPAP